MSESVHGHEVLHLLLEASTPLTRDSLRRLASDEFGHDARYHTCSAESMSLDDLIEFLIERGKITESGGQLVVHPEEMCSHS